LTADLSYGVPNVIFNEGIPGDLSDELTYDRLDSILERHPDANRAFVMIGTNDAAQNAKAAGIDCIGAACAGTIKGVVRTLVQTLKANSITPMLARIPPIFGLSGTPYTNPLDPSTRNTLVNDYNTAIGQVEAEEGLQAGPNFFDLFLGGGENRYTMFDDLLHPNALGYALMAHEWKESISPSGSPSPLSLSGICVTISSPACQNPATYKQNLLQPGDKYYIDRDYILTSIPAVLQGGVWLLTANNQKANARDDYLSFTVDRNVDVYVAFMPGVASLPTWMGAFTDTGLSLGVTAGTPSLDLYVASYSAGATVALGGNLASGAVGPISNNYIVIVVPQ
jgi:lysophospholipase L1-like esterase